MRKLLLLVFFCSALFSMIFAQEKVRAKRENNKAANGQLMKVKAEVYYHISEGKIVMHNTYPQEFIMITNDKGEAKIYFPTKNQVLVEQKDMYSADSDMLYFFLTGNASDMGLADQGFQLTNTHFEGQLMITKWTAPVIMNENISQVELVLDNYLPVYLEFLSKEDKPINKLYFSKYENVGSNRVPLRITEIIYVGENDSIVNRLDYSDILTGSNVSPEYFDFKIPDDAQLIKMTHEKDD
ncbi:MAG: hypothetical protein K9H64_19870 [Bacteroidales bacterium]|nr:hypothetical protein [Bacteroidales bacterium]MCF8458324.1 hypothetical protein [Bacteroidales bacterium]